MRNTLIIISMFMLVVAGGEVPKPGKAYKASYGAVAAAPASKVKCLENLDSANVSHDFIARVMVLTATHKTLVLARFSPTPMLNKPFARAPPPAA